jgi:hypothetical protein
VVGNPVLTLESYELAFELVEPGGVRVEHRRR